MALETEINRTEFIVFEDERSKANNYLRQLQLDEDQFNTEIFDRTSDFYNFVENDFQPKNSNYFFWLDVNMSRTKGGRQNDGILALKKIKALNPNVPALIYSAYVEEEDCFKAGVDFFIKKTATTAEEDIKNIKTIVNAIQNISDLDVLKREYKINTTLPRKLQNQLDNYFTRISEPDIEYRFQSDLAPNLPNIDIAPQIIPNPPSPAPIEQALITTPVNPDVDMTKEAKIYFGRKVLDYFEQIKLAAERKRAAIEEEMTLDNPDLESIPDLDIQDPMWVAGSQSWQIQYPELNKLEAKELSADKNAYHFLIYHDEAKQLSQLAFTIKNQKHKWNLNLAGIEEIYTYGYNKLIEQLPEQHKILLNLVIAKVCAQAYTALDDAHTEQRSRIFKIGERLDDEWKPEILKLVIQYYNKQRAPLETIKEALDNWHNEAGFPEVMDVLKGQIKELNAQTKEAKVYLSSYLYPNWNTEEYWESALFENKGMIEGTCFLYTAIKLYGRIHAFDIDIVDFA